MSAIRDAQIEMGQLHHSYQVHPSNDGLNLSGPNLGTRINIFNFNNQCCQPRQSNWVQIRNFGTGLFAGIGFGLLGRALGGLFGFGNKMQANNYMNGYSQFNAPSFQYGAGGNLFGFVNNGYTRPFSGRWIDTCGVGGIGQTNGNKPYAKTDDDKKTDNDKKTDDGKKTDNNTQGTIDLSNASAFNAWVKDTSGKNSGKIVGENTVEVSNTDGKDNVTEGKADGSSKDELQNGYLKYFTITDASGNKYTLTSPEYNSSSKELTYVISQKDSNLKADDNGTDKGYEFNSGYSVGTKLKVSIENGKLVVTNGRGQAIATKNASKQLKLDA